MRLSLVCALFDPAIPSIFILQFYSIVFILVQVCLISQSWDNVASMHDHQLIVHAAHRHTNVVHAQTIDLYTMYAQTVSCLSISTVRTRRLKWLQRPHPSKQPTALAPTKCAMATFSLCSNVNYCYWTTDTCRYDKKKISPLALLEARWLAAAPA